MIKHFVTTIFIAIILSGLNILNGQNQPNAIDDEITLEGVCTTAYVYPLNNDSDPDGGDLTLEHVEIPNIVGVDISFDSNTGTIYVSTTDTVSFNYIICDSENLCDTATIFINQEECLGHTYFLDSSYTIAQGNTITVNYFDRYCLLISDIHQSNQFGEFELIDEELFFTASNTAVGSELAKVEFRIEHLCCNCLTVEIPITVVEENAPNLPPLATRDFVNVYGECIDLTIYPLQNDFDPDYGELILNDFNMPSTPGTTVTYDETTGAMQISSSEELSFDYIVCDAGNLCDTATININTLNCNTQENLLDTITISQGETLIVSHLDLHCVESSVLSQSNQFGEFSILNNKLSFTASSTFIGNGIATAEFIRENSCCNCLNIELPFNIVEYDTPNQPPIANIDLGTSIGGCSPSGFLLTNDYDPEGGPLFIAELDTENTNSFWTYDEDNDAIIFSGLSLEYVICDQEGLCDTSMIIHGAFADCFDPYYPTHYEEIIELNQGSEIEIPITTGCTNFEEDFSIYGNIGNASFENNVLTYQAPSNFEGSDNFSLTIRSAGGCCFCQVFEFVIVVIPKSLVAEDDQYVIYPNCTETFFPLQNDFNQEGIDFTLSYVSEPENGTLTVNPLTGEFQYLIEQVFEEESFYYVICDSLFCDTATVTFSTQPCFIPDVELCLYSDTIQLNYNESYSLFSFGTPLNFDTITTINNGTVSILDDNTLLYIPQDGYIGIDIFDCYASIDECCYWVGVPTQVFNINPPADNTAPIANDDVITIQGSCLITIIDVLENDINENNDELTISIINVPQNGIAVVEEESNIITITVDDLNLDLPVFQYEICDPFGLCDTALIEILEEPCPTPEPPLTVNAQTNQNQSIQLNFDATYLPNNIVTTSFDGSLSIINDTTILFQPAPDFTGTDSWISQEVFVSECCGTWPTGGISVMIEVVEDTMVSIIQIEQIDIAVWPNPFTNEIEVSLNKNQSVNLTLYNANGKLIRKVENSISLNGLNELPAAVYLLAIEINNGIIYKKLLKQ